jgi:hypothetical protein
MTNRQYLRGAIGSDAMRSVLAIGLLITVWAAADAATVHRSRPPGIHVRTHQRVTVRPNERVTAPARFAPPGWTDGQTQRWLDNASAGSGLG